MDLKGKMMFVSQNVEKIKYGKMIDAFVFQVSHGMDQFVEFVLKIQFLILLKLLVFAMMQIKSTTPLQMNVNLAQHIQHQILINQNVYVSHHLSNKMTFVLHNVD